MYHIMIILSFPTNRSVQTMQTHTRLLLKKQSNQGPVEQIRRVSEDNFCYFSMKTYVVGTH